MLDKSCPAEGIQTPEPSLCIDKLIRLITESNNIILFSSKVY